MKKPAFTLLELMVVLGIISAISLLGIWGMITFRRVIEQQQGTDEVLSILRETRNMSENNVIAKNSQIIREIDYAYVYRLSVVRTDAQPNGELQRDVCSKSIISTNNTLLCLRPGYESEFLKSSSLKNVVYEGNCSEIYFENLTGKILVKRTTDNAPSETARCELVVKVKGSINSNTIIIDASKNSFAINYQ